jgi:Flp pilus assembly protein TadG
MTVGWPRLAAAARDGATAVEFALVLPMFLLLVFGAIEFGRLLWTEQALQQTAIAGARCMAIAQGAKPNGSCTSGGAYSSANTISYVQNIAGGWGLAVPSSGITSSTSANCGGSSGGFSQITLSYVFNSVVPSIVHLSSGGVSLNVSACYPNNS